MVSPDTCTASSATSARAAWTLLAAMVPVGVNVTVDAVPPTPTATAAVTKAVVASCVVFVPGLAVGADGVPVKVGDASAALSARSETRLVTSLCGWLCELGGNVEGTPVRSPQSVTPPPMASRASWRPVTSSMTCWWMNGAQITPTAPPVGRLVGTGWEPPGVTSPGSRGGMMILGISTITRRPCRGEATCRARGSAADPCRS